MTRPEEYTINEVIQKIESGEIKIPIFQRRYVWNKEQVENLFSTVFNDNPFGAISAIKTTDDYPIFASRTFFEDLKDKFQLSEYNDGQSHDKNNPLYLILDGQQRLQSFYLGLTSKFYDMELCFNKHDGTFKYFDEYDKNKFISVKQLYKKIGNNTYESVAKSFNTDNNEFVNKNIFKFYYHFFFQKRIVMLLAYPGKIEEKEDKKKFIELFKRLNTGGVNVDEYEICVSLLQSFNPIFEKLFVKIEQYFDGFDYYKYGIPFNYSVFPDILENDGCDFKSKEVLIKIIVHCYYDKFTTINNKKTINDNWSEIADVLISISKKILSDEGINTIFIFIQHIYKLCSIINISDDILGSLIYHLYNCFTSQTDCFNLQQQTIIFFKNKIKHAFIDDRCLDLIVRIYLLDSMKSDGMVIMSYNSIKYEIGIDIDKTDMKMLDENPPSHRLVHSILKGHEQFEGKIKLAKKVTNKTIDFCFTEFSKSWTIKEKQSEPIIPL